MRFGVIHFVRKHTVCCISEPIRGKCNKKALNDFSAFF